MLSDIRTADSLTQSVARCAYRSVVWTSNGPGLNLKGGATRGDRSGPDPIGIEFLGTRNPIQQPFVYLVVPLNLIELLPGGPHQPLSSQWPVVSGLSGDESHHLLTGASSYLETSLAALPSIGP